MNKHSTYTCSHVLWVLLVISVITLLAGCGREMRDLAGLCRRSKIT